MRLRRISGVCGAALAGVAAAALSAGAQTAAVPAGQPLDAPYVNVSLLGTDVVVRPERIRFRVTADPGSYLTLILVTAQGRRTVLNPYEKALEGTKRREFIREATTGFETGESYLVAIATRSKFHSSNLVRQSEASSRLASGHFSADGSLNELLNSVLPSAGDDFSAAYVSFRVVSRGIPLTLQYANRCPISGTYSLNGSINDGLYRGQMSSTWLYDDFQDEDRFFNAFNTPYFASACQDRLITPPLLVATLPVPSTPPPPRDTTLIPKDSLPGAGMPPGPSLLRPIAPHPLPVESLNETIGRAMTPLPISATPATPSVPAEPMMRAPLSPVNLAPRIDPVMPVQREPVMPVQREPVMPVQREPVMPVQREPVSPPPPPPPPPQRTSPTPLPPATGTTPANPPPR